MWFDHDAHSPPQPLRFAVRAVLVRGRQQTPAPSIHTIPCLPTQLAQLGDVDAALRSEYALRRRMLIERVNVTLQSFLWSPRLEQKVGAEPACVQSSTAAV